ncbi:LAME_0F15984g1_1 [Lachancea meyersii CBS 8951]|uniref:LAME_0F15984g1_1 n=1 Tax=Lachancea meyersii CBS 8951 TaxID=1266667 RepID=A0A1G4JZ42_9SACH|nr:LAME_0F15984g1_1 [Lachancea meyersii CBS 8951]
MEDSEISKGSYKQKSFLSLRNLGSEKLNSSPRASRTSLSQLKLNLLTDGKQWEFLEDYGLEELRDGFFDPIFTRYEPVGTESDQGDATAKTVQHQVLLHSWFLEQYVKLQSNWKRMLKFWIAFFGAFCICLVRPSGSWIGQSYRYFLPLAVLIHHPVRNVGVQLEICTCSVFGAALGMGWSSLAWYVSVATKPAANHQGGLLFASLFIAVYLSSWLIAANQRLLYFALSYGIAVTYFHTVSLVDNKALLNWKLYWDFGISYLFGLVLSFLVCVLVFPHFGQSEMVEKLSSSVTAIKQLLVNFLEPEECSNLENLHTLQKRIGKTIDFDVSEGIREFLNQLTVARIDEKSLLKFRNDITNAAAPLRSIPTDHKLVTKLELEAFYTELNERAKERNLNTSVCATPVPETAKATLSSATRPLIDAKTSFNKEVFSSLLRSAFSKDIIALMVEMVSLLESLEGSFELFTQFTCSSKNRQDTDKTLGTHVNRLGRKIHKLDLSYQSFVKSNVFTKEMLSDSQSIDSFLFLRYMRQSAKHLISVANCVLDMSSNLHWRIAFPHYPLGRALKRLPNECSIDQGAKTILHYYQAKADVDDIFEQIYNNYTSKHKTLATVVGQEDKSRATVRAVDHKDFSLHTTIYPLRYKIWSWGSQISSPESKWALKVVFVMTFLALPTWLPQSFSWYQKYHCWWAPLSFFILANRRNTGNWASFGRRLTCAVIGIFWGWCANQARHFGSPYVIATFASIFCVILSFNFFANGNRKSSFTGFICFVVIALEPYSKHAPHLSQGFIWKNTWVTGVALLCGILPSIPINWILWSFTARHELRLSVASLLAHISQSYQSVADRYLYRDAGDAPTELTLKFSNIREVRLSQSLIAVREMLRKARTEPTYIFVFKADVYQQLLDGCEFLLEKMIEARISGQYFEVWEIDSDSSVSRALLSLRRDSVASVIFVLYMLSNCFVSKHKVPVYLPNAIMSRKKLFDLGSRFESSVGESRCSTATEKVDELGEDSQTDESSNQEDVSHWAHIHGMAFARAFTEISEVVQKIVHLSREILGEGTSGQDVSTIHDYMQR